MARLNPFRYRGYIYDEETGFYYLRSRYYDPKIGRWINADSQLNTSLGHQGINQFSYCLNNPINTADHSGNKPGDFFATIDEAARDAALYIGPLSFSSGYEYTTTIYSVEKTFSVSFADIYMPKIEQLQNNGINCLGDLFNLSLWTFLSYLPPIEFTISGYSYTVASTDNHPTQVKPIYHSTAVAIVHTHPMGSYKGITEFSPGDKSLAQNTGLFLYVYGPNGELHKYDPVMDTDIPLYDDLPVSPYKYWK